MSNKPCSQSEVESEVRSILAGVPAEKLTDENGQIILQAWRDIIDDVITIS